MHDIDPRLRQAMIASHEGRHEEALCVLTELFAEADRGNAAPGAGDFMVTFLWEQLARVYAPARAALESVRDEQTQRLLAGDTVFGRGGGRDRDRWPHARWQVVVGFNEALGDARAMYALFVRLVADFPDLARRAAWQALPAVVEAGDYSLAERYLGDPLRLLPEVNELVRTLPLFPGPGAAPRLAAELSNLMRAVRLGAAILRGQGRAEEASALEAAALAGIESDEVRTLAGLDLTDPGAIHREIADRRMAQEDGQAPVP